MAKKRGPGKAERLKVDETWETAIRRMSNAAPVKKKAKVPKPKRSAS